MRKFPPSAEPLAPVGSPERRQQIADDVEKLWGWMRRPGAAAPPRNRNERTGATMRKQDEIEDPGSCFNKALENEMLFVLLGRDKTAPNAIRFWCNERISAGKNKITDRQIEEALKCADAMESDQGLK